MAIWMFLAKSNDEDDTFESSCHDLVCEDIRNPSEPAFSGSNSKDWHISLFFLFLWPCQTDILFITLCSDVPYYFVENLAKIILLLFPGTLCWFLFFNFNQTLCWPLSSLECRKDFPNGHKAQPLLLNRFSFTADIIVWVFESKVLRFGV